MAPPLLKVTLNEPLPCQPPGGIKQVFSAKISIFKHFKTILLIKLKVVEKTMLLYL